MSWPLAQEPLLAMAVREEERKDEDQKIDKSMQGQTAELLGIVSYFLLFLCFLSFEVTYIDSCYFFLCLSCAFYYTKDKSTNFKWSCPSQCQYFTWNQSMVQQLIRDGNWRRRFRKASPIGLKATTMCRFSLQRATKKANRVKGLNSKFLLPAWAMGRTVWRKREEVTVPLDITTDTAFIKVINCYISVCDSLPPWFLASHLWQTDWAPPLCSGHCPHLREKPHLWSGRQLARRRSSVLSPQHFSAASKVQEQSGSQCVIEIFHNLNHEQ